MAKEKISLSQLSEREMDGIMDLVKLIAPDPEFNIEPESKGFKLEVELDREQKIKLDYTLADAGYAIEGDRLVDTTPIERTAPETQNFSDTMRAETNVGKLMEDRRVATQAEFEGKGKKEAGVSEGYIAQRSADKQTHMIKQAFKDPLDLKIAMMKKDIIGKGNVQDTWRNRDLAQEYVMGPLYRSVLYDRAPVVEMVLESGKKEQQIGLETLPVADGKNIYIRSKFLDNFQMLGHYTGNKNPSGSRVNMDEAAKAKVKDIQGFEKVIASCLMMGEGDYHSGNIGVVTTKDESGKDVHTAVKIDHGRSAEVYNRESDLRFTMAQRFKQFGYSDLEMPFDVQKFRESIEQMTQISDQEIRDTVTRRAEDLAKQGFQFQGVDNKPISKDEYVEQQSNRLIQNKKALGDLSKTLEAIQKSNMPNSLKNMRQILEKIGHQDVLTYLRDGGYEIEGKDPIVWAKENGMNTDIAVGVAIDKGKKIDSVDPLKYAFDNNLKAFGEDVQTYANNRIRKLIDGNYRDKNSLSIIQNIALSGIENGIKIGNKDPMQFAIENKVKLYGKDPMEFAVEKGIKVNAKDPLQFAMEKGIKIGGQDPLIYAMERGRPVDGKPIDSWLKDNPDILLEAYARAKDRSDNQSMKFLDEQHKALFDPKINIESDIGKLVSSSKYDVVAQKLDDMRKTESVSQNPPSANDLMKNCTLEVLYHATKVGEALEKRESKQEAGKSINDKLRSFGNAVKNLFGKGISSQSVESAKKDIGDNIKKPEQKVQSKATDTHKSLGKFTSKILGEHSGPQSQSQGK